MWHQASQLDDDVQAGTVRSKKWRRLNGHERITSLIQGKKFVNGTMQDVVA